MIDLRVVVDIVVGSGLLGMLLFYESKKRKERASAKSSELENINLVLKQKDSYILDLKTEQLDLKKEKEELRVELKEARNYENKERNKVVNLYRQLSAISVEKVKMREQIDIISFLRCDTPDCYLRKPPHAITEEGY